MKNKRNWLTFCLVLSLLPLWSNENKEELILADEYEAICGDCITHFDEVLSSDAYDDLEKLRTNILPIIAAAEQLEDHEVLARLYPRLRFVYKQTESFSHAIKVGLMYLKLPARYLTKELIIKEHGALSEFYSQLGILDGAYKHHLIALEGVNEMDDLGLKTRILVQSGTVFFHQKDYNTAIGFYKKALALTQDSVGNKRYKSFIISSLATTYFEKGNYVLAKKYIDQQLVQPQSPHIKAQAYQQLGDLFTKQEKLDSAWCYYEKALPIFQGLLSSLNEAEINISLGHLAIRQNELEKAIQFFTSVLEDENLENLEYEASANEGLAIAFEMQGLYSKAFHYQKLFSDLQPYLFQDSSSMKLDKLRMEFLMEKQDKEMEEMDNEKLLFASGAVLLLIILAGVTWLLKLKQQAHRLAVRQKQQIECQNEQLTNYNQRLKRFNSVVSHDLKQPLRTTISMLGLFKRKYFDQLSADGQDYLNICGKSLKQMYSLIEGLLNLTQLEEPKESDMESVISFSSLSGAQMQLQALIQERQANIIISPEINQWPSINALESSMIQLWQNLLANAIKFTPSTRSPKIEVSVREEKHQYLFSVKDNGIGIEEQFKDKIFEMFNRLNNRNSFEGSGIGLATCKRIVEMHGGRIWVDSNNSNIGETGSTFYFTIPKKNKIVSFKEKLQMEAV